MAKGSVFLLYRIIVSYSYYYLKYYIIDGPLPIPWRNYIAIMAAAQYQCPSIIGLQQDYFLMNGGEHTWLNGIDYVPKKLSNLTTLNQLLAHRPWRIQKNHIQDLISCNVNQYSEAWSMTELVHAIIVMCTYHAMCSLSMGIGCTHEIDLPILGSNNEKVVTTNTIFSSPGTKKKTHPPVFLSSSSTTINNTATTIKNTGILLEDVSKMARDDGKLLRLLVGCVGNNYKQNVCTTLKILYSLLNIYYK